MVERGVGEISGLLRIRKQQEADPQGFDAASTNTRLEEQPVTVVTTDSLVLEKSPRLSGENPEHTRILAQVAGRLPPITVHRASMRVIDGMHRVRAAQLNGSTVIEARLIDCADDEAFVLAVTANVTHGLPLSLADRKAAAGQIMAIHPQWSDRAVAAAAGLSNKTVAVIRGRTTGDVPYLDTRLGQDGRLHPVSTAAKRQEAAAMIKEDPGAGLRKIARATGLSPSTVRDVRLRTDRGEHPVPDRYRAAANGSGPEEPKQFVKPRERVPAVPLNVDRSALLEKLSNDPSVRFSDSGRQAIRWLQRHAVAPEIAKSVGASLPPHWAPVVADLARSCAAAWTVLAQELDNRDRGAAG